MYLSLAEYNYGGQRQVKLLRNVDFLTDGFSHQLFYLEELSSKYESLTQISMNHWLKNNFINNARV